MPSLEIISDIRQCLPELLNFKKGNQPLTYFILEICNDQLYGLGDGRLVARGRQLRWQCLHLPRVQIPYEGTNKLKYEKTLFYP